ncbi:phosphate ABC transporter permease PstA [Micromonospora sp. NPDC000089]|uniref:phosphate ABC transporter permease PstA n=1 Tax=unclassified Micromonospora TaxID=2617518 RepID=UPI003693706C
MTPKHALLDDDSTETASLPAVPAAPEPSGPSALADVGSAGDAARNGGTVVPGRRAEPASFEPRRRTVGVRHTDVFALVGAAAAAVALTVFVYTRLAPFDGLLGFVVLGWLTFLGCYALLVGIDEDGPAVRDRLIAAVVHSIAALLLLALVVVVAYPLTRGAKAIFWHGNFFTQDLASAGPQTALDTGGIVHGIVGTLEQISIALSITVPLGLACAVFLNEVPGRFARVVRTVSEAMTALPSIVAGLFIYATVILALGFDRSGFAAALAITVMMLPIVIRAADVVLRLVPGTLREASLALGAPQWRTTLHVLLPTARSGLATSVILGTARGIGETSPVLLTAGFADSLNTDPLNGPQVSLPLMTFKLVGSASEYDVARGFGSATTLLALVLLLFILARLVGGRGPGQLSRGQQARRVRASRRDVQRYARRAPATPDPVPADQPAPAQ